MMKNWERAVREDVRPNAISIAFVRERVRRALYAITFNAQTAEGCK